jgi:hypothetical protein
LHDFATSPSFFPSGSLTHPYYSSRYFPPRDGVSPSRLVRESLLSLSLSVQCDLADLVPVRLVNVAGSGKRAPLDRRVTVSSGVEGELLAKDGGIKEQQWGELGSLLPAGLGIEYLSRASIPFFHTGCYCLYAVAWQPFTSWSGPAIAGNLHVLRCGQRMRHPRYLAPYQPTHPRIYVYFFSVDFTGPWAAVTDMDAIDGCVLSMIDSHQHGCRPIHVSSCLSVHAGSIATRRPWSRAFARSPLP